RQAVRESMSVPSRSKDTTSMRATSRPRAPLMLAGPVLTELVVADPALSLVIVLFEVIEAGALILGVGAELRAAPHRHDEVFAVLVAGGDEARIDVGDELLDLFLGHALVDDQQPVGLRAGEVHVDAADRVRLVVDAPRLRVRCARDPFEAI